MGARFANFAFPTAITFGAGAGRQLPTRLKQIGSRRAFVVTDKGLAQTRAFDLLADYLGRSALGQTWELFSEVHSNPMEQDAVQAAKAFRELRCDTVIAFGGGSAIDMAKVLRLFVKRPDLQLKNFNPQDDWNGLARLVALPTTAGSGSEVSYNATITLAGTNQKAYLSLSKFLPKLVVLDPDFTRDLPPHLTAATGLDALTHCVEAFTSTNFNPMVDAIALEGIRMIVEALPKVLTQNHDMESRGKMLLAASLGGVSCQKEMGAAHSLAHPLSTLVGLHHGLANAACLPLVMRFNSQRKPGLYRRVGVAAGLDLSGVTDELADFRTIEFIERFIGNLGLRRPLHHLGVKPEHFEVLAEQAFADPCHLTNPVPVNREELRALYLAAF